MGVRKEAVRVCAATGNPILERVRSGQNSLIRLQLHSELQPQGGSTQGSTAVDPLSVGRVFARDLRNPDWREHAGETGQAPQICLHSKSVQRAHELPPRDSWRLALRIRSKRHRCDGSHPDSHTKNLVHIAPEASLGTGTSNSQPTPYLLIYATIRRVSTPQTPQKVKNYVHTHTLFLCGCPTLMLPYAPSG